MDALDKRVGGDDETGYQGRVIGQPTRAGV
jgi:hypothetical protein